MSFTKNKKTGREAKLEQALELAKIHLITLGGNPSPDDEYGDKLQAFILKMINDAIDYEEAITYR